jgi:YidC/Oxa1 family membrane protein insertase
MFNTLLVYPIFNLLAFIYAVIPGHDFGIAIILLTVIVRTALWPLVRKQLHSQRAMQELQPEIAKIKAKAAGDRTLEGQMIMELYKEREINPLGSLLPVLIQLPLLLALFAVLRDIVKPGEFASVIYPALQNFPALHEIIIRGSKFAFHPQFLGLIDLQKSSPLLAAFAGITQFFQTKQLMPKHQPKDAAAQATAGLTYIFPFVTFFIGLTLPAALSLYWTSASLVLIYQQWILLRADVKELEDGVIVTNPTPKPINPKKQKGKK